MKWNLCGLTAALMGDATNKEMTLIEKILCRVMRPGGFDCLFFLLIRNTRRHSLSGKFNILTPITQALDIL